MYLGNTLLGTQAAIAMSNQAEKKSWFALTVKPKHEKLAAENLKSKDLEVFLPVYQVKRAWSDRTKRLDVVLFPGYTFCRFAMEERLKVLTTPGITSIVGVSKVPAPVDDQEIVSLRGLVASGFPLQPRPYLQAGQAVRIGSGPLCGVWGTLVREKDSLRVVVSVELLRRSVAVELDREMLHTSDLRTAAPTSDLCPVF